jgi:hypothetical protein
MVLRTTKKYTYPNGTPRKFFGCSRYPACTASHGAHPDGTPLGTPADADTKAARIKAHQHVDKLWNGDRKQRGKVYKLVGTILGVAPQDAHIGKLSAVQCHMLIEKLQDTQIN